MKYVCALLLTTLILFGSRYEGSTTASVTLAGGIIKSTHLDVPDVKYKRKNCPVCKGTGKYLSGDQIKMVDCGYCEPEKKQSEPAPIIKHGPHCTGTNCRIR
jgi:hypothetical protein